MNTFVGLVMMTLALQSFAHMEDKLGPNGGFIKMPGPFHIEVKFDAMNQIHIFLLDMNFEKPTIENSELKAVYKKGKKSTTLKCGTLGTSQFVCDSAAVDPKLGKLLITANRMGVQGNEAIYKLPLQLPAKNEHKSHNSK